MNIKALQEVRKRSYAPLNECKSALQEANGDVEGALVMLQKHAVASAPSDARKGLLRSYVHNDKIAVLIEVNCQTDKHA